MNYTDYTRTKKTIPGVYKFSFVARDGENENRLCNYTLDYNANFIKELTDPEITVCALQLLKEVKTVPSIWNGRGDDKTELAFNTNKLFELFELCKKKNCVKRVFPKMFSKLNYALIAESQEYIKKNLSEGNFDKKAIIDINALSKAIYLSRYVV